MLAMDEASVSYLLALADSLYNDALSYDKAGDQDMATASLGLSMAVQLRLLERDPDPED